MTWCPLPSPQPARRPVTQFVSTRLVDGPKRYDEDDRHVIGHNGRYLSPSPPATAHLI